MVCFPVLDGSGDHHGLAGSADVRERTQIVQPGGDVGSRHHVGVRVGVVGIVGEIAQLLELAGIRRADCRVVDGDVCQRCS